MKKIIPKLRTYKRGGVAVATVVEFHDQKSGEALSETPNMLEICPQAAREEIANAQCLKF